MEIVAEIEGTLAGTVGVVKNDSGTFSVGVVDDEGGFTPKHPDLKNTESVVNALAFYFQAEANKRNKAEISLRNK